ncbi:hypothetical protein GCM10022204_18210 [Microlunatus aurantiacus]|uniref:DUF1905 domain-containing protein n=1 Tax=Microlunatus aurantiacus TaxID=446786 RepID=A0ABP7DAR1_9ACTN
MEWTFEGPVIYWRGPAPFYFVALTEEVLDDLTPVANELTYGWGCIPATATIGDTEFTTSLFPKDGGFLLPVKVAVRRAEGVDEGDVVSVELAVAG